MLLIKKYMMTNWDLFQDAKKVTVETLLIPFIMLIKLRGKKTYF